MLVTTRGNGSGSRQKARGQAMVEFALVAPVFFLLVFEIIELGLLFGGQNGLVAATREEARYAAPFRVKTIVDANNVCADTRLSAQLTRFLKQSIPGYIAGQEGVRTVKYSWLLNGDGTTYSVQMQVHVSYSSRSTFRWWAPCSTNSMAWSITSSFSMRPRRCGSRTRI